MFLAREGMIPPKDWIHDPNIKDLYGNTVEDHLLKNEKEVP